MDDRGFEYIYVKATSAIDSNYIAVINGNADAVEVTAVLARKGERIGVALHTEIPANEYGWLCIYGVGGIRVSANCARDANLYTTATAGQIDDSASGQEGISRITTTQARGGSAGNTGGLWYYPHMT